MSSMNTLESSNNVSADVETGTIKGSCNGVIKKNIGRLTKLLGIMAVAATVTGCEGSSSDSSQDPSRNSRLNNCWPPRFEEIEVVQESEDLLGRRVEASYVRDTKNGICYFSSESCNPSRAILTSVPCKNIKPIIK